MAAVRARAILSTKVIDPLRFFANDSGLGLSPADMGPILDRVFDFLVKVKDNGSLLMDMSLDIFVGVLDEEQQTHYDAWKLQRLNQKGYSVNGKLKVNTHYLVMGALFEPADADMKSTDNDTINLLQVIFCLLASIRPPSDSPTPSRPSPRVSSTA
jgi:hypothetical protein